MLDLKAFLRQVHERSLWQLLGAYAVGAWIVVQVAETLASLIGLPLWFGQLVLVLLALGLPVLLLTAWVQGRRRPREVATDAQDVLSFSARFLSWKRVVTGGLLAFALLAAGTAAWMTMRKLGVGPAATLIARGDLDDRPKIVLADFVGPKSDEELGYVVTAALRIDLLQSPTIRLVEDSEVTTARERMQSVEGPLDFETAREIAIRDGYAGVLRGEVHEVGSDFVITAQIIGGSEWVSLAQFREKASGREIVDAIDRLSRRIRSRAGESLRTVNGSRPLEEVSTNSIEALRLYTRADRLVASGEYKGAISLLEQAITVDSLFAMAHRRIGVLLGNSGARTADVVAALARAYELRSRLPERERHLVVARYHEGVTGDTPAAARAYEGLLEFDRGNAVALNNLGWIYRQQGRFEDAIALFTEALEHASAPVIWTNRARTEIQLRAFALAEETIDSALVRLPAAAYRIEQSRFRVASATRDYDRLESLLPEYQIAFRAERAAVPIALNWGFRLEALSGRIEAAETSLSELNYSSEVEGGEFSNPFAMVLERSRLDRLRGDPRAAYARITQTFRDFRDSVPPLARRYAGLVAELAAAGDSAAARELHQEWQEQAGRSFAANHVGRRRAEAWMAFSRGAWDEAIREWESLERECPGLCTVDAAFGLARAHDLARRVDEAIREYERYLDVPSGARLWRDFRHLAFTLERLALLSEQVGDLTSAKRYYAEFVDLWASADSELQPRVQAARARLEGIDESDTDAGGGI